MKAGILAAMALVLSAPPGAAAGPGALEESIDLVLRQDVSAPVRILDFQTRHHASGLTHALRYTNAARHRVIGVELMMVYFDTQNRFLSAVRRFDRLDLPAGADVARDLRRGRPGGDPSCCRATVIFVERVMMEDGRTWMADRAAIETALRSIDPTFQSRLLDDFWDPPRR